MTTTADKINIVLIIIIIIIICICLLKQRENFFTSGRLNFNLRDSQLKYNFLANPATTDKQNLYYVASIDLDPKDNKHIYFLKHDSSLIKLKIKNTNIENIIPQITFLLEFKENTNQFNLKTVKLDSDGDSIPKGKNIGLNNLKYIPYKFKPNREMKIKSGVSYFMIQHPSQMKFLERDNNNKRVNFIWATILKAKHRHIFFFIPYYKKSKNKATGITQGINSIWDYFS